MQNHKRETELKLPYSVLLALEARNNEMMADVLSRASFELGNFPDMDLLRPHLWLSQKHQIPDTHPEDSLFSRAIASLEAASVSLTATSMALSKVSLPHVVERKTQETPKQKTKQKTTGTTSQFFDPFTMEPTPQGLNFRLSSSGFGLIHLR